MLLEWKYGLLQLGSFHKYICPSLLSVITLYWKSHQHQQKETRDFFLRKLFQIQVPLKLFSVISSFRSWNTFSLLSLSQCCCNRNFSSQDHLGLILSDKICSTQHKLTYLAEFGTDSITLLRYTEENHLPSSVTRSWDSLTGLPWPLQIEHYEVWGPH